MIGIIISLVVLVVAWMFLSVLLKKFPKLFWFLTVAIAIAAWIGSGAWWVGLIAGVIAAGVLAWTEQYGGRQCALCGSYDTEILQGSNEKMWKCNKCDGITYTKE